MIDTSKRKVGDRVAGVFVGRASGTAANFAQIEDKRKPFSTVENYG
jgi:hypothetical protein